MFSRQSILQRTLTKYLKDNSYSNFNIDNLLTFYGSFAYCVIYFSSAVSSGIISLLFLSCPNAGVSLGDTRKCPPSNFSLGEIRANTLTPSTCCLLSCTHTNSLSLLEMNLRPKSFQNDSDCKLNPMF